jgi:molecular chaperone GrpE
LSEKEENDIPIEIKSDESESIPEIDGEITEDYIESNNETEDLVEELKEQLSQEKNKVIEYENKLKHTLADFQNLERKTKSSIEYGVDTKIDQFMLDFLQIYDDFIRAKEVFSKNEVNTEGLDSIVKNMESLLTKYHVLPIVALGEIFDPKLHEAISIIEDSSLDDDTITKEIRKGYISHNRVIRPTLVEISKKSKSG